MRIPYGRMRALEQETHVLDVENKQVKIFKAGYGVTTPQELRRNPIHARSVINHRQALQEFDQFSHVSYKYKDRMFTSQAWNRLFRIQESVIQEYVLEVLSSFKFRDHVVELDIIDTIFFQLGGVKRSMTMRFNALGQGELVDDIFNDIEDEAAAAEARRAQEEEGGVRHHPNMSFTNRLRAMDDRLGDIDSNIYTFSNEVEDLTAVVSRMSEQYDQFYREFDKMRLEQDMFHTWNTDYMS
ncbi:hypothetical protein Tco_0204347 [Tanacetum coccineum]